MSSILKENRTGINEERNPNVPLRYLTATSIMSNKVMNREGEKLGDVKDIMMDITTGKIEYIIIEFGGFLGIGEKFFAIPFQFLSISTEEHAWIVNMTRSALEKAPGFDKNHWPKTNSHYDLSGVYWEENGRLTGGDGL